MEVIDWEEVSLFARRLASKFYRTLPAGKVDHEELMAAALLGLAEARERYDERSQASFKTFAYLRIRGSMLDYLRRERKHVIREEEQSQRDLAESLHPGSYDLQITADIEERISLRLAIRQMRHRLELIDEQHRAVLEKHYFEEKSFSEIGKEMGGIAKATVCRYHRKAISALRAELQVPVAA